MRRKLFHVISKVVTLVLIAGCKDSPPAPPPSPPPYVSSVQLTKEDSSLTEIWLKLRLTDASPPRSYVVKRDSQTVFTGTFLSQDTVLADTGLAMNRLYSYKAFRANGSTYTDSSAPLHVTTMDTTSQNFTFEIDTLGVNASTLFDIAIVNDTLAYAVGQMLLRDSTGHIDPLLYNAAKWDGVKWTPFRIQFYTICGQSSQTPYAASTLLAFGANDVWIVMLGDQVVRWNGIVQIGTMCLPISFTANKAWAETPTTVYEVGSGGIIMHYISNIWQPVQSGTTTEIQDIWGNGQEVLAVASNVLALPRQKNVMRIEGTGATMISDAGLPYDLSGLWFVQGRWYCIVGDGIFWKRNLNEPVWSGGPQIITTFYINAVRGTGVNDVFAAGAYGEFLHFNGSTWHSFRAQTGLSNGQYYSIAIKGNLVFAVGYESPRGAVVLRGRRQ